MEGEVLIAGPARADLCASPGTLKRPTRLLLRSREPFRIPQVAFLNM